MRQLALPFALANSYAAEDFCEAPSNAAAREWLARPEAWSNKRLVLWGEAGRGKTHLLHIWAEANGAERMNGAELRGLRPVVAPVAIDDADAMPEPSALLHLLNSAAEAGFAALLTARLPPARQRIELPDLASRLRASEAVEIRAPEDELLTVLLARLAAERQMNLSPQLRSYLLSHLPRTAACLREATARLDRALGGSGVKATRQLAAEILGDLMDG